MTQNLPPEDLGRARLILRQVLGLNGCGDAGSGHGSYRFAVPQLIDRGNPPLDSRCFPLRLTEGLYPDLELFSGRLEIGAPVELPICVPDLEAALRLLHEKNFYDLEIRAPAEFRRYLAELDLIDVIEVETSAVLDLVDTMLGSSTNYLPASRRYRLVSFGSIGQRRRLTYHRKRTFHAPE